MLDLNQVAPNALMHYSSFKIFVSTFSFVWISACSLKCFSPTLSHCPETTEFSANEQRTNWLGFHLLSRDDAFQSNERVRAICNLHEGDG